MKPTLTMKSNEWFQIFYLDNQKIFGRKHNDDIVFLLETIAKKCPNGFNFKYDGHLSQNEMEQF